MKTAWPADQPSRVRPVPGRHATSAARHIMYIALPLRSAPLGLFCFPSIRHVLGNETYQANVVPDRVDARAAPRGAQFTCRFDSTSAPQPGGMLRRGADGERRQCLGHATTLELNCSIWEEVKTRSGRQSSNCRAANPFETKVWNNESRRGLARPLDQRASNSHWARSQLSTAQPPRQDSYISYARSDTASCDTSFIAVIDAAPPADGGVCSP